MGFNTSQHLQRYFFFDKYQIIAYLCKLIMAYAIEINSTIKKLTYKIKT